MGRVKHLKASHRCAGLVGHIIVRDAASAPLCIIKKRTSRKSLTAGGTACCLTTTTTTRKAHSWLDRQGRRPTGDGRRFDYVKLCSLAVWMAT